MAIASPPSVMVLIDSPKYLKTSAVMKIDTGMAVSANHGRAQVPGRRTGSPRRRPTLISLPCSVPIEAWMKLAWRKVTGEASMPAGSDACEASSASPMLRVRRWCPPSAASGCRG